ncbi:lantibiotic dehydratase [Pedobacter riviphilus]|uniref:Lantibiotic dehydratase n=1 Tax=Pedobacter riviphilus TaxID=2766984 RepID=A0ABX6TKA3_9SPHI|nr:lantibiotic dehydratase [Pedobacter riviphilus]QNR83655.1 lantibiotic dehydratase [Pedobacter riviphilus]
MEPLDFVLLRAPLQSLFLATTKTDLNQEFISSLQLAAPELYNELQKADSSSAKEKLEASLKKYWLRSCTRCTPFGVFAGSSLVNISEQETSLKIENNKRHFTDARLDMGYLTAIKSQIENDPLIIPYLQFINNDSQYETPTGFRYAEYILNEETKYYKLSSVEKTEFISFVISCARIPRTIGELSSAFSSRFSTYSEEEASDFILEVWKSQLLTSHLDLNLTGSDPLENLIGKLSLINSADEIVKKLKYVRSLLKTVHTGTDYGELTAKIVSAFPLEHMPKDILQVDLRLATSEKFLSRQLVKTILRHCEELAPLSRWNTNSNLENFKEQFIEKYGDAEMPLNLVLDSDLGIGYGKDHIEQMLGSEWIEGLPLAMRKSKSIAQHRDHITDFTFSKYQDYIQHNLQAIEITDSELESLNLTEFKFSTSSYLIGSLILNSDKASPYEYIFDLHAPAGLSAANLLGRFTSNDKHLSKLVSDALIEEEKEFPNAIFAEIVHNPQARVGNILLRDHLRKYEIPYLGRSGMNVEHQILLNDIVVSVNNNNINLRSVKHNKRIFPRLSSAHNFSTPANLPIYRFLCDLQGQGLAYPIIWDWGFLGEINFYPRVYYKSIIIKKARWIVEENEVKTFIDAEFEPKSFSAFIFKRKIPKKIMLVQGDNTLLIDTEDLVSIGILLKYIKKYKKITLEEFLFTNENCIVRDIANSPYTNELVIPFKRKYAQPINISNLASENKNVQRKYAPGSEWLYFKIYGGEKTLENILINYIFPFLNTENIQGNYEKFFFVRYKDKLGGNLRIRFYNSNLQNQAFLQREFIKLLNPFLENYQISNIVIDTYVRELERYSEDLIVDSESIFYHDTIVALRLGKLLGEIEEPDKYRLLFVLRSIDTFLDDFGLIMEEKLVLAKRLSTAYFNEHGAAPQLKHALNDKYRKLQKVLFSHMDRSMDLDNEIQEAIDILNIRTAQNKTFIELITSKLKSRNVEDAKNKLLIDYIHMFCNRLFISKQRRYELVVYTFLDKYYSSQEAIKSKKKGYLES